MIRIELSEEDWETVCDALDRAGYHRISGAIEAQANAGE